jgi:glutamyl-tRNA synthetase
MRQLIELFETMENFTANHQETVVKQWISENGFNMGGIMNALRLAIVGEPKGPAIFVITELIGKRETIRRIEGAINTLSLSA